MSPLLRSLDTVRARAFEWPALCAVRRVLPRGRLDGAASVGRGWLLPDRLYAKISLVSLLILRPGWPSPSGLTGVKAIPSVGAMSSLAALAPTVQTIDAIAR